MCSSWYSDPSGSARIVHLSAMYPGVPPAEGVPVSGSWPCPPPKCPAAGPEIAQLMTW